MWRRREGMWMIREEVTGREEEELSCICHLLYCMSYNKHILVSVEWGENIKRSMMLDDCTERQADRGRARQLNIRGGRLYNKK